MWHAGVNYDMILLSFLFWGWGNTKSKGLNFYFVRKFNYNWRVNFAIFKSVPPPQKHTHAHKGECGSAPGGEGRIKMPVLQKLL